MRRRRSPRRSGLRWSRPLSRRCARSASRAPARERSPARAGYSQALVFYHFGSVNDLLLAALDEVSARRMEAYRGLLDRATSVTALAESARAIFVEDLDAGYVRVLIEMITGAHAVPGLGDQVAERLRPWRDLAEDAVQRALGRSAAARLLPPAEAGTRSWPASSAWRCSPASTATGTRPSRCSTGSARWPGCSTCSAGCACRPRKGRKMTQPERAQAAARQLDVVTGAFSYSGAAIAGELLRRGHRVRTLTGHPERAPAGSPIDTRPLDFSAEQELAASMAGAHTLYNTYWVRFAHGAVSHELAVANSKVLFAAAAKAGVQRIVHISITNPSLTSAGLLLPRQGRSRAGAGRLRRAVRRRPAGRSCSAATACWSTTSPGCCAGCRSSPSAAAATTGCGRSTSTTSPPCVPTSAPVPSRP